LETRIAMLGPGLREQDVYLETSVQGEGKRWLRSGLWGFHISAGKVLRLAAIKFVRPVPTRTLMLKILPHPVLKGEPCQNPPPGSQVRPQIFSPG